MNGSEVKGHLFATNSLWLSQSKQIDRKERRQMSNDDVVIHSLSCPTLCDPVDCSTPGSSVHHYLLEFD